MENPRKDVHVELDARLPTTCSTSPRHFVALYHPAPVIEGKALLVPKRDISDFLELSREEQRDFTRTYAKVMNMLLKAYGDESRSYITSMQIGGYEAMPLNRLHIHLIPRSKSDRYAGRDDDMYYDIYEGKGGAPGHDRERDKEGG